ncbi:MAG TPA: efflux RND transporter periplasmic adaptor subunit [Bacteroidales bacterium]
MNTRKFIPFLLILAIAIFGCKQDKVAELNKLRKQHDEIAEKIKQLEKEIGDPEKEKKSLHVSVATIQPSQFKHYIEVQGKLDGEDNVDVYPEGQGVVNEVLVTVGQSVNKGQALARLDVGPANDQLKAIETQYKFAKETFEKQQRLWDQKIGSEMQYLQAKTAKEQLESQRAAILKQIDMMTIKAPINGTVEEVNVKIGQFSSAAMPTPPFRVLNFGTLKVKADVSESYSKKVNVGDNVQVYFPDLNQEITAKVTAASRFINPTNRTFSVEVRLNPDKNGYKANMVAVLKITDYTADNAIAIPVNYIQSDPDGLFVYVADSNGSKNVAKRVGIVEGQSYNGMVEITKGLTPGQKVVTSGYLDLEEGETITF